jgi:hypothetical protein
LLGSGVLESNGTKMKYWCKIFILILP